MLVINISNVSLRAHKWWSYKSNQLCRRVFFEFSRSARFELSGDNLAVYDGLTSLTSRGVTPEATDRRPLSSKILATDVYPLHYLFIPTRAPTIPPSLSRRPPRRRRDDDDESVSQRGIRAR